MVNLPVLVLNLDYQPLNVCSVRRAMVLCLHNKAEIMENGMGEIRTVTTVLPIPSVIRILHLVHRPWREKRLTRFEIFNRDHFTCQYCGRRTGELTIDHIIPRHRGGQHLWENVASACVRCNRHKAGQLPWEAGMKLINHPTIPPGHFHVPRSYLESYPQWLKFLPGQ